MTNSGKSRGVTTVELGSELHSIYKKYNLMNPNRKIILSAIVREALIEELKNRGDSAIEKLEEFKNELIEYEKLRREQT